MSLAIGSAFYARQVSEWLTEPQARASGQGTVPTPSGEFEKLPPQVRSTAGLDPFASNLMNSNSPWATSIDVPFRKPLASGERLFVQVAAVRSEAETFAWIAILRQKDFSVLVRHSRADGFYRVLIGPCPDEKSAQNTQQELEAAGYESFVRH